MPMFVTDRTSVLLCAFVASACGGEVDSAHGTGGSTPASHPDAAAGGAAGSPSGSGGIAGALMGAGGRTNDPSCPSSWSELTDINGYPQTCTASGVTCYYPAGQGQCTPNGDAMRWWTNERTPGCSEYPPAIGAACTTPGDTCQYIVEPPSALPTSYCCNGDTGAWELRVSGCPNGITCGTILAEDYDQSCATDADCVGVKQGDLCASNVCTNCVNGAISAHVQTEYEADFRSRVSVEFICPCPSPPSIVCEAGVCALSFGR